MNWQDTLKSCVALVEALDAAWGIEIRVDPPGTTRARDEMSEPYETLDTIGYVVWITDDVEGEVVFEGARSADLETAVANFHAELTRRYAEPLRRALIAFKPLSKR